MKLVRFGESGQERPGIVSSDGEIVDVSDFGEDYDERCFESGGLARLADWYPKNQSSCPKVAPGVRLGSPVRAPSKIVCVGLNYRAHAAETAAQVPKEPVLFMKATTALCGPFDNVVIPRGSKKTDWEVELAVIIGKRAKYVPRERALDYVAGYAVHNDYSEREFQLERAGQWDKGKGCDTFAPLGPWLVTTDEIKDPQALELWLSVNGKVCQKSSTADMIFGVAELVSYISNFMTLLAGDVISTGTPQGVGMGMKPQTYLKPGDVVELGIEGLGKSRQQAVSDG